MKLRPFFSYYGSKWSLGRHYPPPLHPRIREPFAGSAGYSLGYPDLDVVLVDSDHIIAGVWDYLIHASAAEIRSLPVDLHSRDDVPGPQEARWLVGFWLGRACSNPRRTRSAWGRDGRWPQCFWGASVRDRIAAQVEHIRHWKVICGSYEQAPEGDATLFIDPPYIKQGRFYKHGADRIDFAQLAAWCQGRGGAQVIVCENEGADWLPFRPFRVARANSSRGLGRVSREVIWTNTPTTPRGQTSLALEAA